MQIKFELSSPGKVSALENKKLLSNIRAYRKSATSPQMDVGITMDGPLCTGKIHAFLISNTRLKMVKIQGKAQQHPN